MELGHTSSGSATSRRQDVTNCNILNECGVEFHRGVHSAEDVGEEFLGECILESTLLCLCNGSSESSDDDDVVVVLSEDGCLARHYRVYRRVIKTGIEECLRGTEGLNAG
jgi:hypothetical protein